MKRIIKHTESLDDLVQMGDAMSQDVDNALLIRLQELMKENNIDDDDVEDVEYGVTAYFKITKKRIKNGK